MPAQLVEELASRESICEEKVEIAIYEKSLMKYLGLATIDKKKGQGSEMLCSILIALAFLHILQPG